MIFYEKIINYLKLYKKFLNMATASTFKFNFLNSLTSGRLGQEHPLSDTGG